MVELQCSKCDYNWRCRIENPKTCPRCKSRYWNFKGYTKCEVCSKNFLKICEHHIDGNHKNNKKSNLVLICTDCHGAIHWGIGRNRKGIQGGKGKINNYGDWRGKKGQVDTIKRIKIYQDKLKVLCNQ